MATKTRKVKSSLESIFKAVGIKESDDDENVSDYIWEATKHFRDEYAMDAADEKMSENEISEIIEQPIQYAIEEAVSASMWKHKQHAIESALESAAHRAGIKPFSVNVVNWDEVVIEFDPKGMLRAWGEETSGQGYSVWDPSLKATDIKSAATVARILDSRDEVYGPKNPIQREFEGHFDRFEPDTGSYSKLAEVAKKAIKENK